MKNSVTVTFSRSAFVALLEELNESIKSCECAIERYERSQKDGVSYAYEKDDSDLARAKIDFLREARLCLYGFGG